MADPGTAPDVQADPDADPAADVAGRVTMADRVVVKVAQQAAAGASTPVRGGLAGTDLPHVDVELAGARARVRARVASTWPEPAADVAARVRDTLREELERLVGVHVDDLVVTVADVRPPAAEGRRVR
ncbi:hypothetical protein ACH436_18635 [Isoptericola sp. NPDC019693]|uniref:hypothetical protein n=1 Tax=Isoptericola sp. NPDC019693 TaxID=3364009 RepID=UPI0037996ADA